MDTTRAHARHDPPARPRGDHAPVAPPPGAEFGGTGDWIARRVGPDRDVLLLGPDAIRHAGALANWRCRVLAVGCGAAPARGSEWAAVAGDLDALDLDATLGERRFDAIVATELLDAASGPVPLLHRCRAWLRPGGLVVASQSGQPRRADDPTDGRPAAPRGGLIALVEGAGYAVTGYQPLTLPAPLAGGPGAGPISTARVDRELVAAVPIAGRGDDCHHPEHRALAGERDAAARHAADLAIELRGARAENRALATDLDRSRRREGELAHLLRLAHERAERGDDELRALAGRFADDRHALATRFQAEIDRQVEARRLVEERLGRLRRSLPGRVFLAARALAGRGPR